MKLSGRNKVRYILLVAGAVIFLVLGIIGIVSVATRIDLVENEFLRIILLSVFILLVGTAAFLGVILYIFYRNNKMERLAYINLSFNVPNELFFLKMLRIAIKKGHKGSVITFYFQMHRDQMIMQIGYEQTEKFREILLQVSQTYLANIKGAMIAFNSHSFCLAFIPEGEVTLETHISNIEKEFQNQLRENEIYSKIDLAFGVVNEIKKDDKAADIIENSSFACLSVINSHTVKNIIYYDDSLVTKSVNELQLRREIERGLQNEEFEVYYQPKFNIRVNRFVGAEALVKWNHPERGIVSAGGFIPFAEKSNLIVDLDRYIFRHVLMDIVRWKKRGDRLLPVSINLTMNDAYQQDLIPFLKTSFSEFGVSPQLVELELTESAISKDTYFIVQVLKQIRALGIKVNMDDFGTGYSSLSMLSKLPLDTMKVDKSFFDQVEIDKKSRDVVKGMINLGKTCGLSIIAEGIETEKQIEFLKTTKCDIVQGYYYSPSLKRSDYERLLKSNKFEGKETKKV